jgi:hypothetical protein
MSNHIRYDQISRVDRLRSGQRARKAMGLSAAAGKRGASGHGRRALLGRWCSIGRANQRERPKRPEARQMGGFTEAYAPNCSNTLHVGFVLHWTTGIQLMVLAYTVQSSGR